MTVVDKTREETIRAEVKAWLADNWDPQLTVRQWWKLLADSGWGYPTWPEEWFGKGFSGDQAQIVRSELKAVGALAPPHEIGQTMAAPVILQFGTDEQKQRLLPAIASGEVSWCQFFSEPDAGSDLASLKTRAVKDGEQWIVNGQKVWNSGTLTADWGVLPLRTDPNVPKHKGLSFFMIEVEQPGVEVRPILQLNGEAHFNETFFTDAVAADENLIGGLNNGWAVTLATLANERSSYAAGADYSFGAAPGEKSGMLDLSCVEAVALMKQKNRGHTAFPLGNLEALADLAREMGCIDDPTIRQRLMALHAMSETSRLTAMRAKAAAEAGKPPGAESSLGHLAGVHIARATRDLGLAIVGAGGMLSGDDAPRKGAVHQMALTSLVHGIQGGTEHIQRNIIGERVLGLPKEPQVDRDVAFKDVLQSGRPT